MAAEVPLTELASIVRIVADEVEYRADASAAADDRGGSAAASVSQRRKESHFRTQHLANLAWAAARCGLASAATGGVRDGAPAKRLLEQVARMVLNRGSCLMDFRPQVFSIFHSKCDEFLKRHSTSMSRAPENVDASSPDF